MDRNRRNTKDTGSSNLRTKNSKKNPNNRLSQGSASATSAAGGSSRTESNLNSENPALSGRSDAVKNGTSVIRPNHLELDPKTSKNANVPKGISANKKNSRIPCSAKDSSFSQDSDPSKNAKSPKTKIPVISKASGSTESSTKTLGKDLSSSQASGGRKSITPSKTSSGIPLSVKDSGSPKILKVSKTPTSTSKAGSIAQNVRNVNSRESVDSGKTANVSKQHTRVEANSPSFKNISPYSRIPLSKDLSFDKSSTQIRHSFSTFRNSLAPENLKSPGKKLQEKPETFNRADAPANNSTLKKIPKPEAANGSEKQTDITKSPEPSKVSQIPNPIKVLVEDPDVSTTVHIPKILINEGFSNGETPSVEPASSGVTKISSFIVDPENYEENFDQLIELSHIAELSDVSTDQEKFPEPSETEVNIEGTKELHTPKSSLSTEDSATSEESSKMKISTENSNEPKRAVPVEDLITSDESAETKKNVTSSEDSNIPESSFSTEIISEELSKLKINSDNSDALKNSDLPENLKTLDEHADSLADDSVTSEEPLRMEDSTDISKDLDALRISDPEEDINTPEEALTSEACGGDPLTSEDTDSIKETREESLKMKKPVVLDISTDSLQFEVSQSSAKTKITLGIPKVSLKMLDPKKDLNTSTDSDTSENSVATNEISIVETNVGSPNNILDTSDVPEAPNPFDFEDSDTEDDKEPAMIEADAQPHALEDLISEHEILATEFNASDPMAVELPMELNLEETLQLAEQYETDSNFERQKAVDAGEDVPNNNDPLENEEPVEENPPPADEPEPELLDEAAGIVTPEAGNVMWGPPAEEIPEELKQENYPQFGEQPSETEAGNMWSPAMEAIPDVLEPENEPQLEEQPSEMEFNVPIPTLEPENSMETSSHDPWSAYLNDLWQGNLTRDQEYLPIQHWNIPNQKAPLETPDYTNVCKFSSKEGPKVETPIVIDTPLVPQEAENVNTSTDVDFSACLKPMEEICPKKDGEGSNVDHIAACRRMLELLPTRRPFTTDETEGIPVELRTRNQPPPVEQPSEIENQSGNPNHRRKELRERSWELVDNLWDIVGGERTKSEAKHNPKNYGIADDMLKYLRELFPASTEDDLILECLSILFHATTEQKEGGHVENRQLDSSQNTETSKNQPKLTPPRRLSIKRIPCTILPAMCPNNDGSHRKDPPDPARLYVYSDTDTFPKEIAEIYCYTENDSFEAYFNVFQGKLKSYNLGKSWTKLPELEKLRTLVELLRELENRDTLLSATMSILYVVQGNWDECSSEREVFENIKRNVLMLQRLAAFEIFSRILQVTAGNLCQLTHINYVDSYLTVLVLNILCTIAEVLRDERSNPTGPYSQTVKKFSSDLLNPQKQEYLIITLLKLVVRFTDCSKASAQYPIKKTLLLVHKLILLGLGGFIELEKKKGLKRKDNGLLSTHDEAVKRRMNKMRGHSHGFPSANGKSNEKTQKKVLEICKKLTKYIRPSNEIKIKAHPDLPSDDSDLDEDQNVDVSSIAATISGSSAGRPKVYHHELKEYVKYMKETYGKCNDDGSLIQKEIQIVRNHFYIPLGMNQMANDNLRECLLLGHEVVELTPTECLYQAMGPDFIHYIGALLKILSMKCYKDMDWQIQVDSGLISPNPNPLLEHIEFIDTKRHEEIIMKTLSAILILLLKHLRLNHVYQYELMIEIFHRFSIPVHLIFYLNTNVPNYVREKNEISSLEFPTCVLKTRKPTEFCVPVIEPNALSTRNLISAINLMRIFGKLIKFKKRAICEAYMRDAHLFASAKIDNNAFKKYGGKILKTLIKFTGNWWMSNQHVLEYISGHTRGRLILDNFLNKIYKSYYFKDRQIFDNALKFNTRRYHSINHPDGAGTQFHNCFEEFENRGDYFLLSPCLKYFLLEWVEYTCLT